jgi:hypothetical protein
VPNLIFNYADRGLLITKEDIAHHRLSVGIRQIPRFGAMFCDFEQEAIAIWFDFEKLEHVNHLLATSRAMLSIAGDCDRRMNRQRDKISNMRHCPKLRWSDFGEPVRDRLQSVEAAATKAGRWSSQEGAADLSHGFLRSRAARHQGF